jgi:short-subunit dehydrogenase involved in D-alanine esterification of teichoic acids
MKKIAITGHKSGLGKELYRKYKNSIGFDIIEGYDIKNPKNIIDESQDCDIFINNAYDGLGQAELFKKLETDWYQPGKWIINISSMAVFRKDNDSYAQHKRELERVTLKSNCRITNIRISLMDTPLVITRKEKKLNPSDVADMILEIIDRPFNVKLLEIDNINDK